MDQAPLYHSKRSLIALMAIAASCPFVQAGDLGAVGASSAIGTSSAGYYAGGQSGINTRAQARREERTNEAMAALEHGRQAYREQDYEKALEDYKRALDILPNAPVTDSRRAFIVSSIADASVAVAQQYRKVGRYDEARQLLNDALKIKPNSKQAQRELAYLDDPERTNPANTPQHQKNVEEVTRLLQMAYGYFDLGQFNEAKKAFQDVIRIDPYNIAARRGMETVDNRRSQYYRAAYDHTRAEMLAEVDKAWESPLPMEVPVGAEDSSAQQISAFGGSTANMMKLKQIIIPTVDFEDTTVEEAIEFLRSRSVQLDTAPGPNGERGINFVINDTQTGGSPATADTSLDVSQLGLEGEDASAGVAVPAPAPEVRTKVIKSLKLRNVPMLEVLRFICQNAGLRYKVEDYAVNILPAGGNDTDFYTRTFAVPPNFISSLDSASGDSAAVPDDPFSTESDAPGSSIKPRPPVTTLLKNAGITFPEGASASYFAGNSTLLVRNSTANLDMIEQLIENMKGKNKQVKITTKFVEITQENTDELSYDWVVTPFSVNDSRSLFMGGGNSTGSSTDMTTDSFVSGAGTNSSKWPIPATGSSTDPINGLATGGIRSGTAAITRDGIDNLLKVQDRSQASSTVSAPGILSVTGIYDEGTFQAIMRGLSQKKATDVLTAPSITAKPGEEATIEIIREFIYPTEFEPPQIPQSTDSGNYGYNGYGYGNANLEGLLTGGGSNSMVNSYPVTPTTPIAFEMKPVGVTLKVQPEVGENDYVIDMRFEPSIIEFEGFVNYGSPIQSTGVDANGDPVSITLTDNRIEQPIFSTRSVKTSLFIYDGHTVAIGGLISEDVQIVEDKVPIFGDLPFVGRFFRGNSENHVKKNLMIFVTGQIIDATGQPIRGRATSETAVPVSGGDGLAGADAGLLPMP